MWTGNMQESETRRLITKFADETTLHGISNIIKSKSCAGKCVWTVVFLLSLAAFSYYGYSNLTAFLSHKKNLDVEIEQESVTFPQVTLCNIGNINLSNVEEFLIKSYSWKVNNYKSEILDKLNKERPHMKKYLEYFFAYKRGSHEEILREVHTRKSLAKYVGRKNAMHLTRRFDLTILRCFYLGNVCEFKIEEVFDEFYFKCFTLTFLHNGMPLKVNLSGPEQGISLFTFTGLHLHRKHFLPEWIGNNYAAVFGIFDFFNRLSRVAGLRVLIHSNGDMPFPHMGGQTITNGYDVSYGVTTTKINRLGSPHGECFKNVENYYGNKKYSLQLCQSIFMQKSIWDNCRCLDISLPTDERFFELFNLTTNAAPFCDNIGEYLFSDATNKEVNYTKYRHEKECVMKYKKISTIANNCRVPCEEELMHITEEDSVLMNTNQLTLDSSMKDILEIIQFSELGSKYFWIYNREIRNSSSSSYENLFKFILKHFAEIKIYISNNNILNVRETVSYSVDQLVADFGGMLGLFVGLSAITIAEIVDLVLKICLVCCKRIFSR